MLTQLCLTLCDPMDCSPPSSSVHGILQARILEWVAMPSSTGSSWLMDQTQVSWITGRFFTIWAIKEAFITYFTYSSLYLLISYLCCAHFSFHSLDSGFSGSPNQLVTCGFTFKGKLRGPRCLLPNIFHNSIFGWECQGQVRWRKVKITCWRILVLGNNLTIHFFSFPKTLCSDVLCFDVFYFNSLIWCITWLICEESLHPGEKPTWLWCIILLMCCWILFDSILLRILASMSISDTDM